jgi:hypothetical protein
LWRGLGVFHVLFADFIVIMERLWEKYHREDDRMMFRVFFLMLSAAIPFCQSVPAWAARSELIPETTAARYGLTRSWFTQVELDPASDRLQDLTLHDGELYALTNKAVLHAIDAETGKTLWSQKVGQSQSPTLPPGVNHDFVAVINGSRLYVLNRFNGDLLLDTELSGTPGAGPALSTKRVFVPMTDGKMEAHPLTSPTKAGSHAKTAKQNEADGEAEISEEARRRNLHLERKSAPPLFCQSFGRAMVQPVMGRETPGEENVIWPTDRGYLNLGQINQKSENRLNLKYRLQTGATIIARPAYYPADPEVNGDSGLIVAVSRDGFVYAFREKDGNSLWRFSIGEPIIELPVAIEGRVYVSVQLGGMHCLDIKTGKELWFTPDIVQFVAAGKNRIYASDRLGRLAVLDAQSGKRIDNIIAENTSIKLRNADTDRIYLADKAGLIQCLHEVEQTEPIVHDKQRKLAAIAEEAPAIKETGIDEEKAGKKEHAASKEGDAKADKKKEAKDSAVKEKENGEPSKPKDANPFAEGDDKQDQSDKAKDKAEDKKKEAPAEF